MPRQLIPRPTLQRLPAYLNYLRSLPPDTRSISATAVAAALGLNEVQVRKDLSAASKSGGRPKTGYTVGILIRELEEFLGYTSIKNAVLVGVGRLGGAMLAFTGFEERGVHIIAAFDNDPAKIGTEIGGVPIFDIARLESVCRSRGARIGILTTSPLPAQELCERMIGAWIEAVWNFSTAHLEVPEQIIVRNEDLSVSLAMISRELEERNHGK